MSIDIISKIKEAGLLGKSGSNFPVWIKWDSVKKADALKKYVIANAAEGEPEVFKDGFILNNYPKEVVLGIKAALNCIEKSSGYIYLRKDYYNKFKYTLNKLIKGADIKLFKKTGGYLSGEETVLLNIIEGRLSEPRIKPPYPTESGLFGYPSLINNVETFYRVSKVLKGEYKDNRFYSISGDVNNRGVFEFKTDLNISQILKESNNFPDFDFFVQAGGGISGEILLPSELGRPLKGTGGIIIYNRKRTNPASLIVKKLKFLMNENCDKCVPCREGIYRIFEMVKNNDIDKDKLNEIVFALEETSLCGLGKCSVVSIKGFFNKLL
ncbi:MAG: NADH-ubiquinone oxidoreductase-F iron-sulfur binding region domain-containing protein [Candidatus Pacebacteria bacterium]|nr:NADH-ubiquinone oxidoreductase-F iron-sulfur binding region domain-containing protein [Candidatus Paceibacterota bacterium]